LLADSFFVLNNILTEYERLTMRGIRFINPPKPMEWGEWLCAFVDPDGNEFDLKQPLQPEKWTIS
jgi:predicted enzyme related to lactoylglutathione lyase